MLQLVLEKLPLAPKAGLVNLWHAERFPWHATFTVVSKCCISFALPASLCCEECVYIYIYIYIYICVCVCVCVYIYIYIPDSVKTVFELPLVPVILT